METLFCHRVSRELAELALSQKASLALTLLLKLSLSGSAKGGYTYAKVSALATKKMVLSPNGK